MSARRLVVVLGLAALLAGCGGLRVPAGEAEPWLRAEAPRPRSEADSLLSYFEYLRRLPAAELAKEQEAVRVLFARTRTDYVRVRFAIASSTPGGSRFDDGRALEALAPLLKNADAPLHGIAFMVGAQIQEQRRAQEEQRRAQALNEKLDALKQLEKQMIERDPAAAARQR
jgi:hypothetical protein